MRNIALTVISGGIQRLRTKGAAKNESLYDLLNGHVTAAKTVRVRPGTRRHASLPENTKGLVSYAGQLHTFATSVTEVPDGYACHVIAHPEDDEQALTKIHFAAPYLGFLYVVAEFDDGSTWHFWLQSKEWTPDSMFNIGDVVAPSTPNGLVYKATRLEAARPVWTANASRSVGDAVEPTEYNGYYFTVVDTVGDNPRSGSDEPTWPTNDGEQVIEDLTDAANGAGAAAASDSTTSTPQETQDRYDG